MAMRQEGAPEVQKTHTGGRKKVLFIITKATWGGAQRYVYDLSTHLPQEDFEVVVAYGQPGKLSDELVVHDVRLIPLPKLGRDVDLASDFKSFFQVLSLVRAEKPDIVHLNSSKAAAIGALAACIARVPRIVFTVHGWPFKEARGPLATDIIRFVSWLTAFLSTAVITVSKEDEYIGKAMRGIEKKVRYIPIGITIPEFIPREMASLILSPAMQATMSDWPRLVTIAELTANKGLGYMLEAILQLKQLKTNVTYTVIGEGEQHEALLVQARSLGISDRVHFLGFIPDAARYLKAFDIFVLPSIKEGMPYVLLEAGMAQLPIISTSVVDPTFFQLSPEAIKVAPAEPKVLADTTEQILHAKAAPPQPPVSSLSDMISRTIEIYTIPIYK